VPLKLSANPGGLRRAAPTLGQHDEEIKKPRAKGEKPWSGQPEPLRRSR
jgi:hypothetical protein